MQKIIVSRILANISVRNVRKMQPYVKSSHGQYPFILIWLFIKTFKKNLFSQSFFRWKSMLTNLLSLSFIWTFFPDRDNRFEEAFDHESSINRVNRMASRECDQPASHKWNEGVTETHFWFQQESNFGIFKQLRRIKLKNFGYFKSFLFLR